MSDPSDLDDPENWHGGFYELAVELGPRDDARLARALQVVWDVAQVQGCAAVVGRDPLRHESLELTLESLEERHLHGVVCLPDGNRVVCGAISVREEEGQDWLVFMLPLGALSRADARVGAYPVGADADDASLAWRGPVDQRLVSLAKELLEAVPFQLALVGFDASGEFSAHELTDGVPAERWWGVLVPGLPPVFHAANH